MVFSPWRHSISELHESFALILINQRYHGFNRKTYFILKEELGMVECVLISREFHGEELVSEVHQQLFDPSYLGCRFHFI